MQYTSEKEAFEFEQIMDQTEREVVIRAMRLEPSERFASVEEMRNKMHGHEEIFPITQMIDLERIQTKISWLDRIGKAARILALGEFIVIPLAYKDIFSTLFGTGPDVNRIIMIAGAAILALSIPIIRLSDRKTDRLKSSEKKLEEEISRRSAEVRRDGEAKRMIARENLKLKKKIKGYLTDILYASHSSWSETEFARYTSERGRMEIPYSHLSIFGLSHEAIGSIVDRTKSELQMTRDFGGTGDYSALMAWIATCQIPKEFRQCLAQTIQSIEIFNRQTARFLEQNDFQGLFNHITSSVFVSDIGSNRYFLGEALAPLSGPHSEQIKTNVLSQLESESSRIHSSVSQRVMAGIRLMDS
ncbi:MAG: hypothetical protein ABII22_03340 [Candidatus Micrarchaeota archaeon]